MLDRPEVGFEMISIRYPVPECERAQTYGNTPGYQFKSKIYFPAVHERTSNSNRLTIAQGLASVQAGKGPISWNVYLTTGSSSLCEY